MLLRNGSLRNVLDSVPASKKKKIAAPLKKVRAALGEGILRATLEALAVVGYRALSVEEVAAEAGVNKTTVYRRWPTKKDLVQAALSSVVTEGLAIPETGSLRRDLLALGRSFTERASSLECESLFRVMALESADPELEAIGDAIRAQHERIVAGIVTNAVDRGELERGTDPRLLTTVFLGTLHLKLFFNKERVDEAFTARVVDLLLLGVTPRKPARPSRRARG
jgi:AcrR family transcriptional regulator